MPRRHARLFRLTLLALCVASLPFGSASAQTPAGPASALRERLVPLDVKINDAPGGTWAFLERNGALYVPQEAFDEWRLRRPAETTAITLRGQRWYPLSNLPGYQVRMNESTQSLDLVFAPGAFEATQIGAEANPETPKAVSAVPSLFLSFDTNLDLSRIKGSNSQQNLGALTEIGYSTDYGLLTTSFVGRNLTGDANLGQRDIRRLETTFTRHFPAQGLTARAGDTVTRPSLMARQFYFGGLQLSRDFALTPSFVTQPIPVLTGTSSAPSTVELYVNDVLRQTSKVPTGPFVIDNYPSLSGSGQAKLVVRDVLGRETVIVQPFFTDARLLEAGLSDWSVDLGSLREDFGVRSSEYGTGFVSGLYRRGLTKDITLETHTEWSRPARTLSVSGLFGLPLQLLGLLGAGASDDVDRGRGRRWLLGTEWRSFRQGFTVRAEGFSTNYVDLGTRANPFGPNRRELTASYTYADNRFGSAGLSLGRIETAAQGSITTASANYSVPVGPRGVLTFNLLKVNGSGGGTSFSASLTIPLEQGLAYSALVSTHSGAVDAYGTASKSLSGERGTGWRVLGGSRAGQAVSEGGFYYQNPQVLLTSDASVTSNQQTVRLGAQGSLVYIDGSLFASRKLSSSYALVEVPGYGDVGVGLHGVASARTDQSGRALVAGLLPYQTNSIRLNPSDLPISAELENIEQIVVPPEKSGVKVVFPVRSGRGALLKIVLDDGDVAPAGAEIRIRGEKESFFVARRGEAFVTGLKPTNQLEMMWNGKTCALQVQLPPGSPDDIARVGPLACHGVAR
jgi:outer membrane usher protein